MDASHVPPLGAPGDSSGGASSTSSAPSATSPANETSTSTLPGNTTAALASGHPSATRRLVPAARPGVLFQNRILSECFSLVASPSPGSSATGKLWITCYPRDVCNSFTVTNMLNFCFTAPPDRFLVLY